MSSTICFASDSPLKERPDPHCKTMSVNEAPAIGLAHLPAFMPEGGSDRDKPDILLWSGTELLSDTDKTVDDGNPDDDFAI